LKTSHRTKSPIPVFVAPALQSQRLDNPGKGQGFFIPLKISLSQLVQTITCCSPFQLFPISSGENYEKEQFGVISVFNSNDLFTFVEEPEDVEKKV
jgi:hypothetical protein